MEKKYTLEDLGYSNYFRKDHSSLADTKVLPARVIAEHKELYIVKNENSEFLAKVTGKVMHKALSREDYPAVGDWVSVTCLDQEQAQIHEILPRKTVLKRKIVGGSGCQIIASNIDVAFVVQSPGRDFNLNRFERYFSMAESGKIRPEIILNKTDLITEDELESILEEIRNRFTGTQIYTTSVETGYGMIDLKEKIKKGHTYCFLGSSGVGKSSLINALLGKDMIKTGEISSSTNRGKHITTHRELFVLKKGGVLVDNPGMREIGLLDSNQGMQNVFSNIYDLANQCRFVDCTHRNEPGCAILEAVETGNLDRDQYNNYLKLLKEDEFNSMTNLEKQEKDRKFGKFLKTSKKQLKKYR